MPSRFASLFLVWALGSLAMGQNGSYRIVLDDPDPVKVWVSQDWPTGIPASARQSSGADTITLEKTRGSTRAYAVALNERDNRMAIVDVDQGGKALMTRADFRYIGRVTVESPADGTVTIRDPERAMTASVKNGKGEVFGVLPSRVTAEGPRNLRSVSDLSEGAGPNTKIVLRPDPDAITVAPGDRVEDDSTSLFIAVGLVLAAGLAIAAASMVKRPAKNAPED